ncbi:siderophore-interacting protein [Micromonospora sp. DT81.3]|uniref:siderophore-interacting protein n=1 Tax=Micromonospora sp. DT81.3 TaxID=3416523 RepID=UPI003CF899C3
MSIRLTVTATTWVTPVVRRVHFRSDDLSAFAGSVQTDRYVKIVFPKPGVEYPEPLDIRSLRGTLPPEHMPDVRTYTAIFPDLDAGTVAIDFVLHGDEGVAGPWAARAQPGDTLLVNGPGGGYRPDPEADWHLLVGDESAMPAITAALHVLDPSATARVVLLVDRPGYEPVLPLPANGTVTHVYRSDVVGDETEGLLVRALRAMEWPDGRVHAFVHGEAQETMHGLRPLLLKEHGLARDQVSVSGYWRRGRTEDGFRAWKSELAQAEAS